LAISLGSYRVSPTQQGIAPFALTLVNFLSSRACRKARLSSFEATRGNNHGGAAVRGASIYAWRGTVNFHPAFQTMSNATVAQLLCQKME
jgi:hypothetical protein